MTTTVVAAPEITQFDLRPDVRRTTKETEADRDSMRRDLAPIKAFLTQFALMPNAGFDDAPNLLVAHCHYSPHQRVPRGIVLRVGGATQIVSAPVAREDQPPGAAVAAGAPVPNTHLLTNHLLGTGVSAYALKGLISEQEVEERLARAKAEGRLPRISAALPQHSISVVKFRARGEGVDRLAIVVKANDTQRALALMEHLAEAPQTTLAQVYAMPAFKELLESSQRVRNDIAQRIASALAVVIEPEPFVSHPTHTIERALDAGGKNEVYRIYHDATPTEQAHSGALVSAGALGGWMHVLPAKATPRTSGTPSFAWSNARLSAMPTTTGPFDARVHTRAEMHTAQDANAAKMFDKRWHYTGADGLEHPTRYEKLADRSDPAFLTTLNNTKGAHPLSSTDMHAVAGVVHDTTTGHYMTVDELLALAKRTKAKSITVPLNHTVVQLLINNWDRVKTSLPPGYTLEQLFANEFPLPVDPLLAQRSALDTADDVKKAREAAAAELAANTQATGPPHRGGFGGAGFHGFGGRPGWRGGYRRGFGGFGTGLALATPALLALAATRPPYGYPPPYPYPYPSYYR